MEDAIAGAAASSTKIGDDPLSNHNLNTEGKNISIHLRLYR
jgi:hypothetical protein